MQTCQSSKDINDLAAMSMHMSSSAMSSSAHKDLFGKSGALPVYSENGYHRKKKKKNVVRVICSLLRITISHVLFLTNKVDERFLSEASLQIL